MSHTPGPWEANYDEYGPIVFGDDGSVVATCHSRNDIQLIATAPEMLEALERARSRFVDLQDNHPLGLVTEHCLVGWIEEIDKVLEKARGQA
jgi:hypothetical protein